MTQNKVLNTSNRSSIALAVSVFYGLLLMLLYFFIYYYINNGFPNTIELAFIFLSTFSGYFYQKAICFSKHYPDQMKMDSISWFVFLIAALFCACLFFTFDPNIQIRLFTIFIIGLFYHNHSTLFLFRNIPLLKNICIALCWIALLFYTFQSNLSFHFSSMLYATDLFLLILAQSIIFDFYDKEDDHQYDHITWSNSLSISKVKLSILILFLLSLLFVFAGLFFDLVSLWSAIAQSMLYTFYLWSISTKSIRYIPLTDLVILTKVILYLV